MKFVLRLSSLFEEMTYFKAEVYFLRTIWTHFVKKRICRHLCANYFSWL